MNKSTKTGQKTTPMTKAAAARIQRAGARAKDGQTIAGSFAARAQRAVAVAKSAKT